LVKLVEVEPGKFRVERSRPRPARSDLALPNIISDQMPPTEQVDGKFYESKRAFRAVGRSLGLIEIGNEKQKPKTRTNDKAGRQQSIRKAIEKYKAGHRA
jgi:hypothetical protein